MPTRSTATFSPVCQSVYLHCRRGSTVSAYRTPRTYSSVDDCQRCTWCRPTRARPVRPGRCHSRSSSAAPVAMPAVDSVSAAVADSAVSSATTGRYKCPDKTPRWSRPMVLKVRVVRYEFFASNFVRGSLIENSYLVCLTIDRLPRSICRTRPAAYIFRSSAFSSAPAKITR